MFSQNRDLLVLTRKDESDPEALEQEVELLNELLFHVENMDTFCAVNEVIDVNRHKIIVKPAAILKVLQARRDIKPFVFINNKN
ncbi:hypothetical protein HNQ91_004034 [Filimonas zeae]|uniref:Uncharacterized protein n=1 Tax=Filimonas zeae TaxID=1737353 RepID=A0A917J1M5_9BACT|nr:hypothetical protein [Filimonas zeae]MDR6340961.1 hypothetical protein [Filimonas zeae]GGH77778.1 hypothetical protein GCM10011379_44640 [Filimonas zeae]